MTELLKTIQSPADLKSLSMDQLKQVAQELREFIVDSVSQTGGHFASNLGTVELAVALHRIFDSPRDKIIWDVGHQAYPHKILTGRRDRFSTLRQYQGLSGFLRLQESPHDVFGAGHSSTSISAALGYALARDHRKEDYKCIAVIGDGALTAGMAFEAMNHAGDLKRDLIIVLNDNKMSISPNVGAISAYLNSIITGDFYNLWKNRIDEVMNRIPKYGSHLRSLVNRFEEGLKGVIVPGVFFEEMGIRYFGPIDGHNLDHLIDVFEKTKNLNAPRLIHVITTKGKGYKKAEKDPLSWHGPPKAQFAEEMKSRLPRQPSPPPRRPVTPTSSET
jgi:1-deoxy-D-xylulose-5-phosphate synthase